MAKYVKPKSELADDLLVGADAIAEFLFGDSRARRRVYIMVQHELTFPAFYMGKLICARKSSITQWINNLENQKLERKKHKRHAKTDTTNHHAGQPSEPDPDTSDTTDTDASTASEMILLKQK